MKKSLASAAALMLVLSACDVSGPRNDQFYGLVDILAIPAGDELQLVPTAVFFRAGRATPPDSRLMTEACVTGPFNPEGDDSLIPLTHINAGDSVIVESGLSYVALYPLTLGQRTEYEALTGELLAAPNAALTVNTVGVTGGFPAMSHSSVALGPPAMTELTLPTTENQDMLVTWTQPTNDQANKIELAVTYRSPDNQNLRLVCVFHDDGQAAVAAVYVNELRESIVPPLATATRFRASYEQIGASVLIVVARSPRGVNFAQAD